MTSPETTAERCYIVRIECSDPDDFDLMYAQVEKLIGQLWDKPPVFLSATWRIASDQPNYPTSVRVRQRARNVRGLRQDVPGADGVERRHLRSNVEGETMTNQTTRQTLCPARDYKVVCETPMACGAQCRYADDPVHPNRVEVPASQTTIPAPQFPMPGSSSDYTSAWMDGWRAAWLLIDTARAGCLCEGASAPAVPDVKETA